MILRVFSIEDDPDWMRGIESALKEIPPNTQKRYGITSIDLTQAGSKEEALELLNRAKGEDRLPDVMILDLEIPCGRAKDSVPDDRVGIEVLKEAQKIGVVKEVLVYSVYGEKYELAVETFSGGAIDFAAKATVVGEELLARVLASGTRLLARENARLLEQRLKDLVPYAEIGLAHRLGACFSRFVQSVVNETEGLAEGLKERWGLDVRRDSQDAMVGHVLEMQGAIKQSQRDWTDIVSPLIGRQEVSESCVVEAALGEVRDHLAPSLAVNHVKLAGDWEGETVVRTFRDGADDVKVVLKEIVLGALCEESPVAPPGGTIDVKVTPKDGYARVQFKDSLARIDDRLALAINRGVIIPPGRTFGRGWGLSVARHLAKRGGGKLKVEPNENGNVITYWIPLADHAKSAPGR